MGATVDFYLRFCDRELTATEVILKTPKPLVVEALVKKSVELAKWAIEMGRELVLIYLEGSKEPYIIESWLAMANQDPTLDAQQVIQRMLGLEPPTVLVPELDISRHEADSNDKAIYLTRNYDQTILYANPAALRANKKAPEEMIGKDCVALWEDEILVTLDNRLQRDQRLTEYQYPGFRWVTDEEGRKWRRAPYIFTSNYWLLPDYHGTGISCRYCEILHAVPASQREVLQLA